MAKEKPGDLSAGGDGIAAQTAAQDRGVNGFPDIAVTNLLNNSLKGPRLNFPIPAL